VTAQVRYQLEKHTDHATHCWCVVDTQNEVTYGFGLLEADASNYRDQLVQAQETVDEMLRP